MSPERILVLVLIWQQVSFIEITRVKIIIGIMLKGDIIEELFFLMVGNWAG